MPHQPPAPLRRRRAGIECFARDLEPCGRGRVTRRLCTIAWFYRCAVGDRAAGSLPAVHVRRPRLGYESHDLGLLVVRTHGIAGGGSGLW
jgi:hypothetical protein